jgi:hypothetical protein
VKIIGYGAGSASTRGQDMRKFDQETAIIAIELQQMLAEFGHEIDIDMGLNISDFYL